MTLHAVEPITEPRVLATRTEYAVRTRDGVTVPVGDAVLMAQTVAEFLTGGRDAEPVVRTVTEWRTDQTTLTRIRRDIAREQILATAQRYWEGETSEADALVELRPHAPAMSDHDRAERLGELVSELEHAEDVDDRRVAYRSAGEYEELVADAERRVTEAADALYGGAS